MLVLLSSDYSPRYKQDVLRCLAAPVGSSVQFRYDKAHVSHSVLSKITKRECAGPGLVCSVATKGIGPLTIVPVRLVDITAVHQHGSTVSISMKVSEILCDQAKTFTAELDHLSAGESPRKASEESTPEGKYFFEVAALPQNLKPEFSLATWEQTVTQLREQLAYQDEPFFFVFVGIQRQGETLDTTTLHPMPKALSSAQEFEIVVYHYQPKGAQRPNSKLELLVGPDIDIAVPPDSSIDSRYDLKIWKCRTTARAQTAQPSWLRIRTADTWDLDIPVRIVGSWGLWVLRAIVTGILIAIPSVLAVVPQSLPVDQKHALYATAVVFGFFAALVATFKIDRLD